MKAKGFEIGNFRFGIESKAKAFTAETRRTLRKSETQRKAETQRTRRTA
jgi:hypothetical protein